MFFVETIKASEQYYLDNGKPLPASATNSDATYASNLIENTFDKNGIWDWPKDYNKASGFGDVLDGDLWELNVKIDEKKVKSYGACCYPKSYKKLMKMFSDIFDMDFNKILAE